MLRAFSGGIDGTGPGSLLLDSLGNLYGTAEDGGNASKCPGGCGLVFRLEPNLNGPWKEMVLHTFNGANGYNPDSILFGNSGSIYGATLSGGIGEGLIFKLENSADWPETVLYEFTGGSDGGEPIAPLAVDSSGNIFGTTVSGGSGSAGVVFEIIP